MKVWEPPYPISVAFQALDHRLERLPAHWVRISVAFLEHNRSDPARHQQGIRPCEDLRLIPFHIHLQHDPAGGEFGALLDEHVER